MGLKVAERQGEYGIADYLAGAAIAGAYLAASWGESYWLARLGVRTHYSALELGERGLPVLLGLSTVYVPSALLIAGALVLRRCAGIRSSVGRVHVCALAVAGAGAALVSVGFDRMLIFPWVWRYLEPGPATMLRALSQGDQWPAIAVWFVVWVLLLPVLEEVVFRGLVIQASLRCFGSERLAIVMSATSFAAAHLGLTTHPSEPAVRNAIFAGLLGVIVAAFTVRRQGRLDVAIGAHWGNSIAGFVTLCLAT